jgi:broad specificity phosphatase PhoE
MRITFVFLLLHMILQEGFAQESLLSDIGKLQNDRFNGGECLDFLRAGYLEGLDEGQLQQIIIIRHGEPAMNKKGWKNRKEAIRYTEMYDSVGVYYFDEKPVCLRSCDKTLIFTSKLPRAINTAEKTMGDDEQFESLALFNEFERKVITFPNITLPRQFWSITTRAVWMMGFNDQGIESFGEAKSRAGRAAAFLDEKALSNEQVLLFAHGFLNRYIKKYLKKSGYQTLDLNGQKYLGAYYFYKLKTE